LQSHKSAGYDQISADLIREEVGALLPAGTKLLIIFAISKNCVKSRRSQLLIKISGLVEEVLGSQEALCPTELVRYLFD
jgi:hypothetical protein